MPDSQRLLSLDVFRGLTIAAMILVTDPGTYAARYAPLCHAKWQGATPTDMIFPAFLFIAGAAIPFAFASRIARGDTGFRLFLQVLRRSVLLFLIGLLLNGFPDFHLHAIRIPGILQRIAICYLCGATLYFALGKSPRAARLRTPIIFAIIAALLAGYWVLLKFVPVPGFGPGRLDTFGNLPAYIDRAVFTVPHLWAYGITPGRGVTFDPEGLLSTLPPFATLLIGMLAGQWLRGTATPIRKAAVLALAGAAFAALGLALSPLLPLNKQLSTPTFALLSSGVALLALAIFYLAVDVRGWRAGLTPALVFGTNAILAFAISTVITTLADRIRIAAASGTLTLHELGYQRGFATWLSPINASLAYAIAIVLLNLVLVYPLYRKRIFLRL